MGPVFQDSSHGGAAGVGTVGSQGYSSHWWWKSDAVVGLDGDQGADGHLHPVGIFSQTCVSSLAGWMASKTIRGILTACAKSFVVTLSARNVP